MDSLRTQIQEKEALVQQEEKKLRALRNKLAKELCPFKVGDIVHYERDVTYALNKGIGKVSRVRYGLGPSLEDSWILETKILKSLDGFGRVGATTTLTPTYFTLRKFQRSNDAD